MDRRIWVEEILYLPLQFLCKMPKEQSLPADSHDAWHNLWIMAPQPLTQGESRLEAEFHPSNLEDEAFDRSTYMFQFLNCCFCDGHPQSNRISHVHLKCDRFRRISISSSPPPPDNLRAKPLLWESSRSILPRPLHEMLFRLVWFNALRKRMLKRAPEQWRWPNEVRIKASNEVLLLGDLNHRILFVRMVCRGT